MGAAIAEAKAKADAEVQQATNWCASEIAKVEADLAIAQQETQKRVVDAQTRRAAMIAESEGQVAAQVAQVTAEIEKQKARALQVKRKLDADVVQVAESLAAGDGGGGPRPGGHAGGAGQGRGRGPAPRLRGLRPRRRGRARRPRAPAGHPHAQQVSGAGRKLVVQKVSVLPQAAGNGGGTSRARVIAASEQIKAAMGVDVPAIARRLEGADTVLPAPAAKARVTDVPRRERGPPETDPLVTAR
jgi:flotillin